MDEGISSFLRDLVREQSGIVLDEGKTYLLDLRLAPLAASLGYPGIDEMLAALRADPKGPIRYRIVEALTTNETLFFRDVRAFAALKDRILPELAAKRGPSETFHIWSAASSSGQEAYSIAMLVATQFPHLTSRMKILGTDLSENILAKARQGRYNALEVSRGLPPELLPRCFTVVGTEWKIRDDLARMTEFQAMNLIGEWPPLPMMDVIFMCNVLIYFDDRVRRAILEKVWLLLKPDGYLFLGGVENLLVVHGPFLPADIPQVSCYRRSATLPPARPTGGAAPALSPASAGSDQREFTRVPVTFTVVLVLEDQPPIVGRTDDVSLGGLFLQCNRTVKVDAACQVTLLLMGGEPGPRIEAAGIVIRTDKTGIGVSFTRLSGDGIEHLRRLVMLNAADKTRAESEISAHLGIKKMENR